MTVTGEVADVRPYLWSADVSVVPLRIARGVQNKVLESLAASCPVVASPAAVEGLAALQRAGEDLAVEHAPPEPILAESTIVTSGFVAVR